MNPTTLTFDWGDTLGQNHGMPYFHTSRLALTGLRDDLVAAGGHAPPADWVERSLAELGDLWVSTADLQRNPELREFDYQAMLERWLVDFGPVDDAAGQQAVARFFQVCSDIVRPFPDAAPTLAALKARGWRIGILSHVPWPEPACRAWFVRHGLAPSIDFLSLSSTVGWIKPDPRHFADAIAKAGCPPDRILHIGDHPIRDVAGAAKAGLHTCLVVTEGIYPVQAMATCQPDLRIAQVGELVRLLGRPGD